jgi:hypothetical protein
MPNEPSPAKTDLYGAISDAVFEVATFDFGNNVTLAPAKAYFMRPCLITSTRPETSFPAMSVAAGGFGFDLVAELKVPSQFELPNWFDQVNTIWWLAALMRLRGTPRLRAPIISNTSFANALRSSSSSWPVESESERTTLVLEPGAGESIAKTDLEWVGAHWVRAGNLMNKSSEFNLAFQAFDQSAFARDPTLALLLLWSAIEALFSPGYSELRFRVSANIATFIEAPGEGRALLHRRIVKLYDARSAAVHGRREVATQPLIETYALLKRALIKIIDRNVVPSISDIESALLA